METEKIVVEERNGALDKLVRSSSDPKKLSMTISGALVLLAGLLLPKANLGADQITNIVDGILNIAKVVVTIGGMVVTILGALRKMWNQIKEAYKKN